MIVERNDHIPDLQAPRYGFKAKRAIFMSEEETIR